MRGRLIIGTIAAAALALAGCQNAQSGTPVATGGGGQPTGANTATESTGGSTASSGADKPSADGGLDRISEASLKAGTAKVSGKAIAEVGGQSMEVMNAEGAIDFTAKRTQMTNKMLAPGGAPQGDGFTSIIAPPFGYLRYNIGGKPGPWMKFDLNAMLGKQGTADLGSYISFMAGITESSQVGNEAVRGVDTTHYKVTVDPEKVLKKYPEMKDTIKAIIAAAERVAPGSSKGVEADAAKPQKYDIWVDKAGLIYRISQQFTTTTDDGKQVNGKTVTEYYDYGQPVTITPPSDAEVKPGN